MIVYVFVGVLPNILRTVLRAFAKYESAEEIMLNLCTKIQTDVLFVIQIKKICMFILIFRQTNLDESNCFSKKFLLKISSFLINLLPN